MKNAFLFLLCCTTIVFVRAQSDYEVGRLVDIKAINAPEASALQKFGDIPVNYAAGLPNISFPLCQIASKNLQVPVTLSYHPGGIKVSEVASCVGLGFSLSAGGRINRIIIDKDDFGQNYPLNFTTPAAYIADRNYIYQNGVNAFDPGFQALYDKIDYDKTYGDRMSDRYSLFLPNGTSIIFRKNFATGEFIQTPFENLRIEYINDAFKITANDGTIYHFGNVDNAGWNLTKIENSDKTESIDFTYGAVQTNLAAGYPTFIGEKGHWVNGWPGLYSPEVCSGISGFGINHAFESFSSPAQYGSSNNLVTKISTNAVEVQFSYSGGRSDPGVLKLNEINVVAKNTNRPIKRIVFNYTNFGTIQNKTWRLKLSSFSITPAVNTSNSQIFTFGYHETNVLPPYYDPNYHPQFHEDYWGYYNGGSGITLMPIEIGSLTGTSRNPDPGFAMACSLKEVVYPTGGRTVYEMEGNFGMRYEAPFYGSQATLGFGPGLRVKTIKNYTSTGVLAQTKTFTYEGESSVSVGSHLFSYDKRFVFQGDPNPLAGYEVYRTVMVSDALQSYGIGENSAILYGVVKEFNGTETDNTGYTSYHYGLPSRQEENAYELDIYQKHAWQWDYGRETPLLSQVLVYKKDPGAPTGYALIRQEINEYQAFKQSKFPTGIHIIEKTTYRQARGGGYLGYFVDFETPHPATDFSICLASFDPNQFGTGWVRFFLNENIEATETSGYTASHLLTQRSEYVLSNGAYLTNNILFTYDPVTLLLKTQQTTNSKGEVLKSEYKYTSDYTAQEPYTTMVNTRNIISSVIESKEYNGQVFLNSSKTNYSFFNSNNLIKPSTIETKNGTANTVVRVRYYEYDHVGNPLSFSKENDVKQSILWDYTSMYPVAKIENASLIDIAYTSFEAEGKGNWNYSGNPSINASTISGKKAYDPALGSLTKTVTEAGAYIVSYWSKNGQRSISGGSSPSVITGRNYNGWIYYQHRIVVAANSTVTISGSGEIDELRLYPEKANMSTYTYEPLVGIISQSDFNNRITYYEYDLFNRLHLVRDQDDKIIQKICYDYAGQQEECNTVYNVAKSGNFTRNNCSVGQGATVTYNVPAGIYGASTQVAADALAQNDVNANGQAYANQVGGCLFGSISYSGNYYSSVCGSGEVPEPVYVSVPANMFTSSVSQADANSQALAYAQNYANTYGTCSSNVQIYGQNDIGDDVYIILTNTSTYQQYYLYMSPFTWLGQIGSVPAGNYDVEMGPSGFAYASYSAGCSNFSSGYVAFFYNIPINSSCKSFNFY